MKIPVNLPNNHPFGALLECVWEILDKDDFFWFISVTENFDQIDFKNYQLIY